MSMTSGGKGTQPFSTKMEAVGKGVARAEQQAASKKVPMDACKGGGSKPYGGGTPRGNGAATFSWKGIR